MEDRGNEITQDLCNTKHIGLNLEHQNKNNILKCFTNSNTKLITLQLLVCVSIKINILHILQCLFITLVCYSSLQGQLLYQVLD